MKLTIIPVDKSVGENGIFYLGLDLSSCGIPENVHALQWNDVAGWIEFKTTEPNEQIDSLPDWAKCCMTKWDEANNPFPPPIPTAEQNKETASFKLYQTDWTTIEAVSDPPKSNPYLSNKEDYIMYRNEIRQYSVYPVAGNINWPDEPKPIWVKL